MYLCCCSLHRVCFYKSILWNAERGRKENDVKQLLSYGGGVQSVAMCVLVARGDLPKPDAVVFADTGREVPTTLAYAQQYVVDILRSVGLELHVAPHNLAKVDLYAHNGDLLLPVFTTTGKMPGFCSSEWKARVVERYVRATFGWTPSEYLTWIGYSLDEKRRARPDPARRYPLLELSLTRSDCEHIICSAGLPLPHKSRCWMCPHQRAEEWLEVRAQPELWQRAVELDEEVEAWGADVYLHPSRKRLRDMTDDDFTDTREEPYRQCGLGMCYL